MPRERDQQRQRVYRAENTCGCFSEDIFGSLLELKNWLQSVIEDDRFVERFPLVKSIKLDGGTPRQRRAWGKGHKFDGTCIMSFPRIMRTKLIGLHELAHGVTHITHGYQKAGHGAEWCQEYVWLVKTFISVEKARQLAQAFRDKGVTRSTKTQLDAARERLYGSIEESEQESSRPRIVSGRKSWSIKKKEEDDE